MKKKNALAIPEEVLNSDEYERLAKKMRAKELTLNIITVVLLVIGLIYFICPVDALPGPLEDILLLFVVTVIAIVLQSVKKKAKKRLNIDVDALMRSSRAQQEV